MKTKTEAEEIYKLMIKQLMDFQINNEVVNRLDRRRKRFFNEFKKGGDNLIFEHLAMNLYSAGMKSQIIDNKWPAIKTAFKNFNVDIVSKFNDIDLSQLLNNTSIIRHKPKINAIIKNAKIIKDLQEQYGSFIKWIESFDDEVTLSENIIAKFNYIGKEVVWDFLGAIGYEAIKPDLHVRRILHRIGFISSDQSSPKIYREVFDAAKLLSEVSNERLRVIDAIIWYYGADRPTEMKKIICGKVPVCNECYLKNYCQYYKNFLR